MSIEFPLKCCGNCQSWELLDTVYKTPDGETVVEENGFIGLCRDATPTRDIQTGLGRQPVMTIYSRCGSFCVGQVIRIKRYTEEEKARLKDE